MRVLIADQFEASGVKAILAAGCEVLYHPEITEHTLAEWLVETRAEVLVVRSTRVTESALGQARLSLIVRAGAGVNTIDVGEASRRGIWVANCPGKNAIAVAELAFGLILSIDRRIPDNVEALRAGLWKKKEFSAGAGLFGKTLGLLGLGNIGAEMVRRAQGFGMPVVAWDLRFDGADRSITPREARSLGLHHTGTDGPIHLAPTPQAVASKCDVLSLHLALAPQTRCLVNEDFLGQMRPGSIFINTSRGELVEESALLKALDDGVIRAGLDVYMGEPSQSTGPFVSRLACHSRVIGTHHIGASTKQAQEAIAAETASIIKAYKLHGKVPAAVNLATRTPATHTLVVRHLDRPGVLAHVFEHLRQATLNVQETENVIFEGALAAVARINVDSEPSEAVLEKIRSGNPHILDVTLVCRMEPD